MDEDQLYIDMPSYTPGYGHAARRSEEMYRAVLLGVTTGAGLVQCLAWLFRYLA
jgi:hypothetical protein